jgi:hypothetical protein
VFYFVLCVPNGLVTSGGRFTQRVVIDRVSDQRSGCATGWAGASAEASGSIEAASSPAAPRGRSIDEGSEKNFRPEVADNPLISIRYERWKEMEAILGLFELPDASRKRA